MPPLNRKHESDNMGGPSKFVPPGKEPKIKAPDTHAEEGKPPSSPVVNVAVSVSPSRISYKEYDLKWSNDEEVLTIRLDFSLTGTSSPITIRVTDSIFDPRDVDFFRLVEFNEVDAATGEFQYQDPKNKSRGCCCFPCCVKHQFPEVSTRSADNYITLYPASNDAEKPSGGSTKTCIVNVRSGLIAEPGKSYRVCVEQGYKIPWWSYGTKAEVLWGFASVREWFQRVPRAVNLREEHQLSVVQVGEILTLEVEE